MYNIQGELNKLGIACESTSILQDKDGVTVARITSGEKSYVIKCFQKENKSTALLGYSSLRAIRKAALRALRCFAATFAHKRALPSSAQSQSSVRASTTSAWFWRTSEL